MRHNRTGWSTGWIGALLLMASGCTISIQPWQKGVVPPPGMDPNVPGLAPVGHQGIPPRLPPGIAQPPNTDLLVQMNKQLTDAEVQRNALLEQVQTLKRQVKDREDNIRLASHEIEESSTRLRKTREEFRQWEGEMQELRERVRKLEENRKAVGAMIGEILHHLDRPREPLRLPSIDPAVK